MAKKQEASYSPKESEIKAMYICIKNDLAYVIQPIQYTRKYKVVKFQISNRIEQYTYKENNIDVEFTEYDALKKTMELYTLHAKRFTK
jgi:hypothetical protein